jgi:nucleoside-diphosphate-sugar epimerase
MKKILVTGGAGNLGRSVTEKLIKRHYFVRIFDMQRLNGSFASENSNIEIVTGDIRDSDALSSASMDVDWIVHLAAVIPPLSEENKELTRGVNIDGTKILLKAVGQKTPVIFASSVATYGLPRQEIITCDHPQDPIDYYGETKLQNEKEIKSSGLPWVLLRITGISIPALLEIPRPWFFARTQRLQFVHLSDAATAIANCVENTKTLGQIFQIAGDESWRMSGEEYSKEICQAFDIPPESASYLEEQGWPGWYDTARSEAVLGFQHHSFNDFINQLRNIYQRAIG